MFYQNPELRSEIQAHNRILIINALKALGISRATIEYNGGGDSGDVNGAATEPTELVERLNDTSVTVASLGYDHNAPQESRYSRKERTTTLREALDHFVLDWVYMQHPGWENNDGGRGEFTVYVNEGRFELEHYEFYTESSHYAYELP